MNNKGLSKASAMAAVLIIIVVVIGVAFYSSENIKVWYDEDGERENPTPDIVNPSTEYYIYYYPNGGSGSVIYKGCESGTYSVDNCTFTHKSAMFKEWNTKADGSGVSYKPGSGITVNSHIQLFAIWVWAA